MVPHDEVQRTLARFRDRGATHAFIYRPGEMIECSACHDETHAEEMPLLAFQRIPDPEGDVAVVAMACPHCGADGTTVFAPGPASPEEEATVMNALLERSRTLGT